MENEFIGEIKSKEIMNEIKNFDDIREQLTGEFEELYKFLCDKKQSDIANDLEKELKKLKENIYQIAFIATMKAGKSTLINAFLGCELLPSLERACTGRLTFINHNECKTIAHITTKSDTIVISYRHYKDLETYLKKYLETGHIKTTEVYCKYDIDLPDKFKYVDKPFEKIDENYDIFENQAKLILNQNKILIPNPNYIELGSFINNKNIDEIKIDAPIKYLKKHIPLDGIQFVDTPGPNSAAHSDHKRITYNFIDKANVVIYVIDFSKFDIEGEDELLLEIKRQREKYDSKFYEKFFFVINKIDSHEEYKDTDLLTKINDIRNRIQNYYGYKVPDNHIIGVAAKPALLYRLYEQQLIDEKRKKDLSKYMGFYLNLEDIASITPKEIEEARKKVLYDSNIEILENSIVNYLKNNDKTKQLILDAIAKAKTFSQNYKRHLQQNLGIFKTKIEELEQKVDELEKCIKEAEDKKKDILKNLEDGNKSLRNIVFKKYNNLQEELNEMIDSLFVEQPHKKEGLLSSMADSIANTLNKMEKIMNKIFRLKEDEKRSKNEIESTLNEFNKQLTDNVRDLYMKFEAELKTLVSSERKEIYNRVYNYGNEILNDLNRKVGETLKIKIDTSGLTFPPLELESIVDIVEKSVYKTRDAVEQTGTTKEGWWTFSEDKPIYSNVTYYSLDLKALKENAKEKLGIAIKNGKSKSMDLLNNDISKIGEHIIDRIDTHIAKLRLNLQQAVARRRTEGFDAQNEVAKIETNIDKIDQIILTFDSFIKITQNLKIGG